MGNAYLSAATDTDDDSQDGIGGYGGDKGGNKGPGVAKGAENLTQDPNENLKGQPSQISPPRIGPKF